MALISTAIALVITQFLVPPISCYNHGVVDYNLKLNIITEQLENLATTAQQILTINSENFGKCKTI
jgi:hypothetical protein